MIIDKNSAPLILSVMLVSLFFVACSNHKNMIVSKKTQSTVKIEKSNDENKSNDKNSNVAIELTPIKKCIKEKNRYNLIVNAPFGSIVRIMNIMPVYKDCIALKKGKYNIEVVNDGFKKYNKWISLNDNTTMDVKLEKRRPIDKIQIEKNEFKKAEYNKKALEKFIKKYPKSDRALIANNRIGIIKKKFRNYSPNSLIKSNGCIGFYPKNLVEKMLTISTSIDYWNSIRWSGSCKNNLMMGRGVVYFKATNGISVELKGKMKNGFFEGKVYNNSSSKNKISYIKGSGSSYYIVKLKNRFDFKQYQE